MTALRDDRGRFTTRAQIAATEVLEAAVADAMRMLREDRETTEVVMWTGWSSVILHDYDRPAVVRMLAEATRSADLVLGREGS